VGCVGPRSVAAGACEAVTPALACSGLMKRFGGVVATDELGLAVAPGEIHALIGPNGAGKSTAIALLAGELRPDAGRVLLHGADVTGLSVAARARRGLIRSYQITSVLPAFTTRQNLAVATQVRSGHSFRFWREASRDPLLGQAAERLLGWIGLEARADIPAEDLSHGEQRQLELGMALACEPSVLLLDEPMAGLGSAESAAMVALIAALRGGISVLLVEHDMDAVFALADRISVLVAGREIATGRPEEIRARADVRAAYLGEEA
jgi:branched-chain amino acid transport system ATP-binding protein